MPTRESRDKILQELQDLFDCQQLAAEARFLVGQARFFTEIVEGKRPADPDWLEASIEELRERADKLIHDHGELLARRTPPVHWLDQEYWKDATETVVSSREQVSTAWMAVTSHVVELRYPPGAKGWWYALLRALGLRKGIDRKSLGAQS